MLYALFMCCHKKYSVIPPLFNAIQCGASCNPPVTEAMPDNKGDNISELNPMYCELTAHYYAWKNIEAEYYGFCHYRRFFCIDESIKRPYAVRGTISQSSLNVMSGDEAYWNKLLPKYDIIVPRSEDMGIAAREHYCTAKYHYPEDLQLFVDILKSAAPHLTQTAESYLSQNKQYFCNMFIMKKNLFFEYCDTLFKILKEFDKHKTMHNDFQSDRTDGYLGEIFTGIFIQYCYDNGAVIKELPRIDAECSWKKKLGCFLLPPESKRRFAAKRFVKRIRG